MRSRHFKKSAFFLSSPRFPRFFLSSPRFPRFFFIKSAFSAFFWSSPRFTFFRQQFLQFLQCLLSFKLRILCYILREIYFYTCWFKNERNRHKTNMFMLVFHKLEYIKMPRILKLRPRILTMSASHFLFFLAAFFQGDWLRIILVKSFNSSLTHFFTPSNYSKVIFYLS